MAVLLARDPAGHAPLDDPLNVAWLLRALTRCGADEAVTTLLARDPAQTAVIDPFGIPGLLEALRDAGDDATMITLAGRAATFTPLRDLSDVCTLLECLHEIEAAEAWTSSWGAVAARRSSTRSTTVNATQWSAASIGSSDTGPWPPARRNSPSATKPLSSSQRSASGCDQQIWSIQKQQPVGMEPGPLPGHL